MSIHLRDEPGWIYALEELSTSHIKIGCTQVSVEQRRKSLTGRLRSHLVCVAVVHVPAKPFMIERRIHERLRPYRIDGNWEWFDIPMNQQALETLAAQSHIEGTIKDTYSEEIRSQGVRCEREVNRIVQRLWQQPAAVMTYSQMMTRTRR